jgi:hypothetical protein
MIFVVAVQAVADVSTTVRRPKAVDTIETSQKAEMREQFQPEVSLIQNQRHSARKAPPTTSARHVTKMQLKIERPTSLCLSNRAPPLFVGQNDVVV